MTRSAIERGKGEGWGMGGSPSLAQSRQSVRNFAANVLEGALSNQVNAVFLSQASILPLFLVSLHAPKWVLGLIPAIATLGNTLAQLFGAAWTASCPRFWPSFRTQMAVCRLSLLLLAITPWVPAPWTVPVFFLLFALYCLACGFALPVWNEFMAFVIPSEARGRFLGWRISLGAALGIGGTWVASRLLQALPSREGFGACFALAALLYLIGFFLIVQTHFDWAPVDRERAGAAPFWAEVIRLVRRGGEFRRYLFGRSCCAVGMGAQAFYLVHAMEAFRLSVSQTSLLALAFCVAPGLSALAWGHVVDQWGAWRSLALVALLIGGAHGVLISWPHLLPFVGCLFLIGSGSVVCTIGDRKWLSELHCAHRGAAVGLFNLLLLPTIVLSALTAGLIAEHGGIPLVFALAGGAWIGGALLFALLAPKD